MSILGWVVLGLIAGWVGSNIVDNGGKGPVLDMVLGIVGAVVGGAIFNALGAGPVTGFNLYSLFVAVVGAVVVLVVYHAVLGRRRL
ncbi:MAG TPA: GlsB/YeaQ/YmgE family stress response membrane protein [Acidocella sp.]|nr:GlsB/YeaQ/YmgE family stress response membrane protein [Acidocella sp.]